MSYARRPDDDRDIPFEGDEHSSSRSSRYERDDCIRCEVAPAVDENGYCGHCHWAVRAEVEEGFYSLREYLRAWARFEEWCVAHDRIAA